MEIGAGSFFADGSIIGGKRYYYGQFEIGFNKIGERSFVGNSAILPVGYALGDNSLLGVQSLPPEGMWETPHGTDWLGSTAFQLPRRDKNICFSETETFKPTLSLKLQRCFIDGLRILVPNYIGLGVALLASLCFRYLDLKYGFWGLLLLSPIVGIILGLLMITTVVGLKWLIMGKFQPVVKPLWCRYVWWNEMLNGVYEAIMVPAMSVYLSTPFISLFLRALGCKIGEYSYIGTTLFSEFDLVKIGNHAVLNAGVVVQNHLFEDRVMKSSYLKIGDHCSVGNMAVILYDSEMKRNSTLAPLSLMMKGETVRENSRSYGIPSMPEPMHEIHGRPMALISASPMQRGSFVKSAMF